MPNTILAIDQGTSSTRAIIFDIRGNILKINVHTHGQSSVYVEMIMLRQMVGRIAINHEAGPFSELLKQDVSLWHSQIWEEFENDFNSLAPLV